MLICPKINRNHEARVLVVGLKRGIALLAGWYRDKVFG
jgi:hypothetical protein